MRQKTSDGVNQLLEMLKAENLILKYQIEEGRKQRCLANKAYYEANKDKIAGQMKAYREANKDKIAGQKKAHRALSISEKERLIEDKYS